MRTQSVRKCEVLVRRLAYIVGLVGPLTALPQVLSIWISHQATGVSLWSEVGFASIAFVWLAYGVILRQTPLVISSFLWVLLDLAIASGVWRYG